MRSTGRTGVMSRIRWWWPLALAAAVCLALPVLVPVSAAVYARVAAGAALLGLAAAFVIHRPGPGRRRAPAAATLLPSGGAPGAGPAKPHGRRRGKLGGRIIAYRVVTTVACAGLVAG